MYKALKILFVSTLFSVPSLAQEVSVSVAQSRAAEFFLQHAGNVSQSKGSTVGSGVSLAYTSSREKDGRPLFYAFNNGANKGFVVIGGDESAKQILCYSDNGTFNIDSIPDNFRWWLSQYEEEISYAINNSSTTSSSGVCPELVEGSSSSSRADVVPMLKTTWAQGKPYSNAINEDFKSQTGFDIGIVTGCGATALAQVMKFYRWPVSGTGSASCKTQSWTINNTATTFTAKADFSSITYDWDNMLDSYSGTYTDEQANAVATLMYHAGVSVGMVYGNSSTGGSSSSLCYFPKAMVNYFDYDSTVRYDEHKYYTDEEWDDKVYQEIYSGRPVLYGGQSATSGGHAFVLDGYSSSDGLYHVNWGWSGNCNCYVTLSGNYALNAVGSGYTPFAYDQEIVTNIMKNQGGNEVPHVAELSQGQLLMQDGSSFITNYDHTHGSNTKKLILYTSVFNRSYTITNLSIGVRAYNKDTGKEKFWNCCNVSNIGFNAYISSLVSMQFNVNDIEYNGTYEIRPVCRRADSTSDADWQLLDLYATDEIPTVTITGGEDAPSIGDSDYNAAYDVNNDGEVNMADVTKIIDFILKKK